MIIVGAIFTLLLYFAIAAIFVWIADRASGGGDITRRSELANLDQRFSRGDIDRAEYEAKYRQPATANVQTSLAQRPSAVLLAHLICNARPRQAYELGKWRIRPA
jgi:hypothetical protein